MITFHKLFTFEIVLYVSPDCSHTYEEIKIHNITSKIHDTSRPLSAVAEPMSQLPKSPKGKQMVEFEELVEERIAHMQTLQQFNDLQQDFNNLLKTSSFKRKNSVLSKQERKRYSQMQLYLERFGSSEGIKLKNHRVLKC